MQSAMLQKWEAVNGWFDALNAREKGLVALAGMAILYGIYIIAIEPISIKHIKAAAIVQKNTAEKHSLELQLNVLMQQNLSKTQSPEEKKEAALQNTIQSLTARIDNLKTSLIKPESMPDLLKDMLAQDTELQLVELKTLPPTGLFEADSTHASHSHTLPVFKHGVEMTVQGRYLDLMHYLSQLEALPWHILWEKADLVVEEKPESVFPLSQLTLVVYSLSLDKAWLSI